jgi:hypothetical protein
VITSTTKGGSVALWRVTGGPNGDIGFNYGPKDTRVNPGDVVDLPPAVLKVVQAAGLVEPARGAVVVEDEV